MSTYPVGSGSAGGRYAPGPEQVITPLLFLHTRTARLARFTSDETSLVMSVVICAAVAAVGVPTVALPWAIYCTPVRAPFATVIQANRNAPKLRAFTIRRNTIGRISANSISACP